MLDENEVSAGGRAESGAPWQPHLQHGRVSERVGAAVRHHFGGLENSYGHPHRDVLERLAQHGVTMYRTDVDGAVTIRTDGKRLRIETGRDRMSELAPVAAW